MSSTPNEPGKITDLGNRNVSIVEDVKNSAGINGEINLGVQKSTHIENTPGIGSSDAAVHGKTHYGMTAEAFQKTAEELGIAKAALKSFFEIIEIQNVPQEDFDCTLQYITKQYRKLQKRLSSSAIFDNSEIKELKEKAEHALDAGDFKKVEALLIEARNIGGECIRELTFAENQYRLSTAESQAELGDLKNTQLEYNVAARYYKEAAGLAPKESELLRAEYLNECGSAFKKAGSYQEAQKAYERSLAIREKTLYPNHPYVAQSLNSLGELLRIRGRSKDALPLFQRALRIKEMAMVPDHLDVAQTQSSLAAVLQELGDLESARNLLTRALTAYEKSCEPGHPEIAAKQSNLATVLYGLGDLEGARDLLTKALAGAEQNYETEHPKIAITQSNLATVLQSLGDLEGSRELLIRSLAAYETRYAPGHPAIARNQSYLSMVLQDMGDLDGARDLLTQMLTTAEKNYAPEHPEIATRQSNLALVLGDLGDKDGARDLLTRAYQTFFKKFGSDHPYTKIVKKNLEGL